jgi:hypothetical protein
VSNPIYVGYAEDPRPASVSDVGPSAPTRGATSWYRDGPAAGWRVETSARAVGALDVVSAPGGGDQILFRFGLGGAPSDNPFVALVIPAAPDLPAHARLAFSGRASRPMRTSLQLRVPSGTGRDERWQRSVFLDTSVRGIEIPLDGMRRRHDGARGRPPLAEVDSVMLVVDTVNTPIGSNGQIWIDDLRLLP